MSETQSVPMNQPLPSIQEPELCYVTTTRVACDGDEGPLGHPRVYLNMGENGYVDCPYCDRRYILVGGPADTRSA